jgi:extracellular elastinolytic metalloproteinase
MDGLKLQPCNPGFVDSRDGILFADQNVTGGANQCAIWRGFAKRGLGASADQGSPWSAGDGSEAFDERLSEVTADRLHDEGPGRRGVVR